jgi:hypothetical protein
MIILICIISDPFTSFYPMIESTTPLIVRKACQNCPYFNFEILFIQNRSPSELFFDAAEQVEVRNREIGGVRRMRDSLASYSSHFINDHTCRVARRIVRMQVQPAMNIIPCRNGMELVQWRDHLSSLRRILYFAGANRQPQNFED